MAEICETLPVHSASSRKTVAADYFVTSSNYNSPAMKTFSAILLLAVITSVSANAQTENIVKSANDFIATLDEKLRSKTIFEYDDSERFNWNFVPKARKGVSLHDLSDVQKQAGFLLLRSSMSAQGFAKAEGIIALEAILREVEGREKNDAYRDPLNYYFTMFGTPSSENVWGWRLEGHHISLNFSSVNGVIESSTPTFMGANPGVVPAGESKGKQTLQLETELGFALVNSLDQQQLKQARFSDVALPEIVSGNERKAQLLQPAGISYKVLTPQQKELFDRLLNVYVKNYQLGFANKLMEKIKKSGLENLSFAWSGSLQPGAGHYYRIQGPMLLIEYDNTQTNANHVHTAVRDLTNDFAEDILREHHERHHK
jgi:hypothetical protein